MESIFDLPAHPLFVHAPLILTPGTALLAALLTIRQDFRRALAPWFTALCGLTLFTSVLAMRSGEAFDKALKGLAPVDEHERLATLATWMIAGLFVLSLAVLILQRRGNAAASAEVAGAEVGSWHPARILAGAALILSVVACVWMFRAGHEGAKAVWDGTIKKAP